jgi:hypothetical protein
MMDDPVNDGPDSQIDQGYGGDDYNQTPEQVSFVEQAVTNPQDMQV